MKIIGLSHLYLGSSNNAPEIGFPISNAKLVIVIPNPIRNPTSERLVAKSVRAGTIREITTARNIERRTFEWETVRDDVSIIA